MRVQHSLLRAPLLSADLLNQILNQCAKYLLSVREELMMKLTSDYLAHTGVGVEGGE